MSALRRFLFLVSVATVSTTYASVPQAPAERSGITLGNRYRGESMKVTITIAQIVRPQRYDTGYATLYEVNPNCRVVRSQASETGRRGLGMLVKTPGIILDHDEVIVRVQYIDANGTTSEKDDAFRSWPAGGYDYWHERWSPRKGERYLPQRVDYSVY